MTRYYRYDSHGEIEISWCQSIQMPDGSWVSNPSQDQITEAGWQVYVEPVVPPRPRTEPSEDEMLSAVQVMLDGQTEALPDEDAVSVAALFPTWASRIGQEVETGQRYWYDGRLWKVIQDHTVQADWTPDTAVSLYVEVTVEEWPEWRQPTGSTDAYMAGDKVTHNGTHWQNTVDYNIYEPGVYGWEARP